MPCLPNCILNQYYLYVEGIMKKFAGVKNGGRETFLRQCVSLYVTEVWVEGSPVLR